MLLEGYDCGETTIDATIFTAVEDPEHTIGRMHKLTYGGLQPDFPVRDFDGVHVWHDPAATNTSLLGQVDEEWLYVELLATAEGPQKLELTEKVWDLFSDEPLPEMVFNAIVERQPLPSKELV